MRLVVAVASSVIGRRLAPLLVAAGHEVVVARFAPRYPSWRQGLYTLAPGVQSESLRGLGQGGAAG